jgi:NAD(P)-dependent dehydrogenase (short-subunit alcohol dehydrogenase family)
MPCVAVTGASSGIGRAIAVAFATRGWEVAVGARRADRLGETAAAVEAAGGKAFAHPLDVRSPASVDEFFDAIETRIGALHAAVANAGMATPGPVHEIPAAAIRDEVETNLLGAILTARRAIAAMRGHGEPGDVVFVTSDATRHARPRMTTYCATKAGVEAFAHALSMELEGTGIRTTTVRVGPTLTEFGFGWDMEMLVELMPYWHRFGLQRHQGLLAPEHVADAVVTAVCAPRGVRLDTIEVQPEAPVGDDAPAGPIDRPPPP